MSYCYGRQPAIHPVGYRLIGHYVPGIPDAPATFDHTNGFSGFKMLGNGPDSTLTANGGRPVGDCGFVGSVNVDLIDSIEAHEPFQIPSSDEVVTDYLAYNHGQDRGVALIELLAYWQQIGLWDSKIAGYAAVNFRDTDELWAACNAFGCLYVGIAVPATAQQQFQAGEPWDLTGTDADYEIEGGHCVVIVSRDSDGGELVTWGRRQRFTDRWARTYLEEAHVVLTASQVARNGDGYGIDLTQLQADLAKLAA